jgi:hypothetical protein
VCFYRPPDSLAPPFILYIYTGYPPLLQLPQWDVIERLYGQNKKALRELFHLCGDLETEDDLIMVKDWLQSAYI